MPGSIICGLDDSESAKEAARVARRLGAHLGLRLVFVQVVGAASPKQEISTVAARLHGLAEAATELDCGADWRVAVGNPADRLVVTAADEKASLIVVGSSGPRFPLSGSVSAEVSRRASCPVVVVPPGAVTSRSNGHHYLHQDPDFPGGIARLGLGSWDGKRDSGLAGGIVRLDFGAWSMKEIA